MGKICLILGGVVSFLIAAVHAAIVPVGKKAYGYFGGDFLLPLLEQGSSIPALVTLGLALIFAIWGAYALSGAGAIRRLPLLRLGLVLICALYLLRGFELIPDLTSRLAGNAGAPVKFTMFSAVSLLAGLLYAIGLARMWRTITEAKRL